MNILPEQNVEDGDQRPAGVESHNVDTGAAPESFDRPMAASAPVLQAGAAQDDTVDSGEVILPPPVNLLLDQAALVSLYVTPHRIEALHSRVDLAVENVKNLINQLSLVSDLLDKLEKARQLLFTSQENYDESERLVVEVEHRLGFIRRVRQASRTVGTWLLLYELFIFLLLAGVFIYINLEPVASSLKAASPLSPVDLVQFFNTLIWGGLGGIVGAFYALWKHIASEQDFDPQYYMWYLTNPILGIALGAFVFLVFQAGFFSLTAGIEEGTPIRSALIIYVFAWVSGFKQNVVYEIVRRILDVFRVELGSNGKEKEAGSGSSRAS